MTSSRHGEDHRRDGGAMTHAPVHGRVREGALAETGLMPGQPDRNHLGPAPQFTRPVRPDRWGWRRWPPGETDGYRCRGALIGSPAWRHERRNPTRRRVWCIRAPGGVLVTTSGRVSPLPDPRARSRDPGDLTKHNCKTDAVMVCPQRTHLARQVNASDQRPTHYVPLRASQCGC